MSNDTSQLQVIDLCFTHIGKSQPTIEGVNLTVEPGEIILIAGATGSGKSTLLNCIAGISPEHIGGKLSGQILYQGVDLKEWTIRQRSQHFCILLQNVETQIFTDRVWEELVFGLENWNIDPAQIIILAGAVLQEFGLDEQRSWLINQLSAGQKQRLLLGCMLATGQPLLLLDEPFGFLDAKGVDLLVEILRSRRSQGQSIILIEHRFDVVREICDRAYRFENGRLSPWDVQKHGQYQANYEMTGILNAGFSMDATPSNRDNPPIVLRSENLSWGGYPAYPDLQITTGEIVLLKGDNGCGKTTLLKLLSGLLKPATGKLEIMGRDVSKRTIVQIAQTVGFVLQNPNHQLFADSVRSEIYQPGVPTDVAEYLLKQLNLSKFDQQHPHSLSQGQKRRLALGAVLARQPQVCLLDEIMVGQDPQSLVLMLNVLQDFTQKGGTLIFTSHDPVVAEVLQARIINIKSQKNGTDG